jgi:hypothetical protein
VFEARWVRHTTNTHANERTEGRWVG